MRTRKDDPIDVLVADDEPLFRSAITQSLNGSGYTCAEAENGREAVEIARRVRPRVVLLDLTMPELDALAAARRLRSDPRTRHARLLCVTGLADPDADHAARQAGFEVVLTKPLDCAELVDVIHASLAC